MAVDRVNEYVSYLYEPLHPALLRLIGEVAQAANGGEHPGHGVRRDGGRADDRAGAARPRHPRAVDERGLGARGQGDDPRDDDRARPRRWSTRSSKLPTRRRGPRDGQRLRVRARRRAAQGAGCDACAQRASRGGRLLVAVAAGDGDARTPAIRCASTRRSRPSTSSSTTTSRSRTSRGGSRWSPRRAHRTLVPALDHAPATRRSSCSSTTPTARTGSRACCRATRSSSTRRRRTSFTELDDHDDWLYGLIAHEYTHILHLDTMSGLPNIYNRIFGKTWAPNQVMPRWVIEGIATYEESKRSAGGRNRGIAVRRRSSGSRATPTRTCGSTRSAARRASSRAATRRTSTARTSCATCSIGSATTRCAR